MAVVPVNQVLARDRGHRGVLWHPRVRITGPIRQLGCLARGNLPHIIISPRNRVKVFPLRQFDLVGPKLRVLQQVQKCRKHVVKVRL